MEYNAAGQIKTYSLPFPIHHRGISQVFDQPDIQTHHYIINDVEVHSIANIKTLNLQCKGAVIRLLPTKEKDIKMHLYGKISSSEAYITPSLLTGVDDEGGLYGEIKHYESPLLHIEADLCLDISIPMEYREAIEINNPYGSLVVDNINEVKEFSFGTITGGINIKNLNAEKTNLKTVTGDITLENTKSKINLETVTGNITVDYGDKETSLNVKTTTGNCNVLIPPSMKVSASFKAITGKIEYDGILENSETTNSIYLETITGSFQIRHEQKHFMR